MKVEITIIAELDDDLIAEKIADGYTMKDVMNQVYKRPLDNDFSFDHEVESIKEVK